MPKRALREEIHAQRRALAVEDVLRRSLEAQRRLSETEWFSQAKVVALYSPIANEVFTESLFKSAVTMGKRVVYPRVRGDHFDFLEVDSLHQMQRGLFGILEPQGSEVQSPDAIDLVVVPGIAFDRQGHRLGYGKGYYDRVFNEKPATTRLVGLCFDFQLVGQLPAEQHDVRMDLLVTESKILRCGDTDLPRET